MFLRIAVHSPFTTTQSQAIIEDVLHHISFVKQHAIAVAMATVAMETVSSRRLLIKPTQILEYHPFRYLFDIAWNRYLANSPSLIYVSTGPPRQND